MKNIYLVITLLMIPFLTIGQSKITDRLQGLQKSGASFYNIEGVEINVEKKSRAFSAKNIFNLYDMFIGKESNLKNSDPLIKANNFVFEKKDSMCNNISQYNTCYFVENKDNGITVILYSEAGKQNKKLYEELNKLILEDKIPSSVYGKIFFNKINFAGREIDLGTYAAKYMRVNSVQWPYNGQISWSIHKDSIDAAKNIDMQIHITSNCRKDVGFEKESEVFVDIIFEGVETKAKRLICKYNGFLIDNNGTKADRLIIYYAIAKVRGNYVACVMSHWNNDFINEETKLPALLEKIMILK